MLILQLVAAAIILALIAALVSFISELSIRLAITEGQVDDLAGITKGLANRLKEQGRLIQELGDNREILEELRAQFKLSRHLMDEISDPNT